ncbi:MAG: hypothetical protein JJE40_11665 [Vicinamibacteria bacterium]|nr:hypothetical protein [Vicinamibacteria bacterium]
MSAWGWHVGIGTAVVLGLFLLDRFLCWCELRGWIYYRLTPRQRRAFGAAAFQVESLLQPEKRHVYEMKQAAEVYREADDDDGGGPPADKSS